MANFVQFNRLKACRYGQMLYNMNDLYIGRSLDLYGEYSEGEVEAFRQIIQPGQVVIEVGANIGAHTLFLAQQVGAAGAVIAFEPQRILFQTLCANLALNSVTNTYCFQNAVGAANGAVIIPNLDYTRENNFGGLSLGTFEVGEQVPQVALDAFNIPRVNFLKIDVEGMEKAVLQGAAKLIETNRPVLYVENDKQDKSAELVRYIDSIGYRMYWHRPLYFNPHNFFGNPTDVFPRVVSLNMLCVHKDQPHNLQGLEQVAVPASSEATPPPAAQPGEEPQPPR